MKRDDPVKMELILDGIQKKFGEKEVLRGVSFPFEQGKSMACWAVTAQARRHFGLPEQ